MACRSSAVMEGGEELGVARAEKREKREGWC
jgi:hypothetical protein